MSSFKPFMTYLTVDQHLRLKRFSKRNNIPIAQIVRESTDAFLRGDDQYSHGYNAALRKAMQVVEDNKASKMRFPSGKSFAELVNDDLRKLMIYQEMKDESKDRKAEDPGGTEGDSGGQGQSDSDLGI